MTTVRKLSFTADEIDRRLTMVKTLEETKLDNDALNAVSVTNQTSGSVIAMTELSGLPLQALTIDTSNVGSGTNVVVTLCGKNLFDISKVGQGSDYGDTAGKSAVVSDNSITVTGGYQTDLFLLTAGINHKVDIRELDKLLYLPSGIYTLSYESAATFRAWKVNETDGSVTQLTNADTNTFELTAPSYITLRKAPNSVATVSYIQIEVGNAATNYEEYTCSHVEVIGDGDIVDVLSYNKNLCLNQNSATIFNNIGANMTVSYIISTSDVMQKMEELAELASSDANAALEGVDSLQIENILLEQGNMNSTNGNVHNTDKFTIRVRTAEYIQSNGQTIRLADGFKIQAILYYDADYNFIKSVVKGSQSVILDNQYAFAKFTISRSDSESPISTVDVKQFGGLEIVAERISQQSKRIDILMKPSIRFDITRNMLDVSDDMIGWNITESVNGVRTTLSQVHSLFDSLVENFPELWEKHDVVDYLNANASTALAYPAYATGTPVVNGDKTYSGVSYTTNLYVFKARNASMSNEYGQTNAKKKLLLLGGVHGLEQAAPFNLYLFAKRLCQLSEEDDYFKFAQTFDVYFVPCVNGWGMHHNKRFNGNGVDINRNYPSSGWKASGNGVSETPFTSTYAGAFAGSEFETNLIMELTRFIQPDIAVDHHNYDADQSLQFYTYVSKKEWQRLAYYSAIDCSIAFKRKYPQYFGTSIDFVADSSSDPILTTMAGGVNEWWIENGVFFPAIIEISSRINYLNGNHVADGRVVKDEATNTYVDSVYNADVFSIGEYTLRNQLLRYGQYVIENQM